MSHLRVVLERKGKEIFKMSLKRVCEVVVRARVAETC